jgi:hypothetical protein
VSDEYREEAHAATPSTENGVARRWRHEGREKRSRITNEVVATEVRTIEREIDSHLFLNDFGG